MQLLFALLPVFASFSMLPPGLLPFLPVPVDAPSDLLAGLSIAPAPADPAPSTCTAVAVRRKYRLVVPPPPKVVWPVVHVAAPITTPPAMVATNVLVLRARAARKANAVRLKRDAAALVVHDIPLADPPLSAHFEIVLPGDLQSGGTVDGSIALGNSTAVNVFFEPASVTAGGTKATAPFLIMALAAMSLSIIMLNVEGKPSFGAVTESASTAVLTDPTSTSQTTILCTNAPSLLARLVDAVANWLGLVSHREVAIAHADLEAQWCQRHCDLQAELEQCQATIASQHMALDEADHALAAARDEAAATQAQLRAAVDELMLARASFTYKPPVPAADRKVAATARLESAHHRLVIAPPTNVTSDDCLAAMKRDAEASVAAYYAERSNEELRESAAYNAERTTEVREGKSVNGVATATKKAKKRPTNLAHPQWCN
jgi:uncharacterized coiled-coil protein SlyX